MHGVIVNVYPFKKKKKIWRTYQRKFSNVFFKETLDKTSACIKTKVCGWGVPVGIKITNKGLLANHYLTHEVTLLLLKLLANLKCYEKESKKNICVFVRYKDFQKDLLIIWHKTLSKMSSINIFIIIIINNNNYSSFIQRKKSSLFLKFTWFVL